MAPGTPHELRAGHLHPDCSRPISRSTRTMSKRKGRWDGVRLWAIGQAVAVGADRHRAGPEARARRRFPGTRRCSTATPATTRWPTPLEAPRQFWPQRRPGLVRLNDSSMLMVRLILRQIDPAGRAFHVQGPGLQLNHGGGRHGDMRERARARRLARAWRPREAPHARVAARTAAMALAWWMTAWPAPMPTMPAPSRRPWPGQRRQHLHKLGQLKSAPSLNRGLAHLRAGLVQDEAYKPADFQNRLRAFRPLVAGRWPPLVRPRWHHDHAVYRRHHRVGPGRPVGRRPCRQLGLNHVLLEAQPHLADTIYKYQKGKHVMAEPASWMRSPMSFEAGTRESILNKWDDEIAALRCRDPAPAAGHLAIQGQKGASGSRSKGRADLRRADRAGHRHAGQPAHARRAGREPAQRAVPARRSARLRAARPSSSSARATRRSRTRWRWPTTTTA
jgi:hypothetical protein